MKVPSVVFECPNNEEVGDRMDYRWNKAEYFIVVDELLKQYGKLTAVNKISFKISFSEIFAFLGPNGAGKTTTRDARMFEKTVKWVSTHFRS